MNKIQELVIKFDTQCMKMSDIKFTFFILGLTMLYHAITITIEILITGVENLPSVSYFDDRSFLSLLIQVIIVGPYIETIIFHAVPLGIYYKIKEKFDLHICWDFVVAGLLGLMFGLVHVTSYPEFTLKGFNFTLIGSIYSYVYFRYRRLNKKGRYGIWVIHALNNLIAIGPRLIKLL